jgi:ferritin-like metal-binding protein YciE
MSSSVLTFHALLIDELQDLLFAENHLIKALPKMAKAATNPALKKGFTGHLAQTRRHVTRLAQALKLLGRPAKGKTCHAMLGLIEEGGEAIELKGPASVRDAALIGAAQRVEHYEIAGYGTARAFADALGESRVANLLQETLDEEGDTNKALTQISLTVNADALAVGGQISVSKPAKK